MLWLIAPYINAWDHTTCTSNNKFFINYGVSFSIKWRIFQDGSQVIILKLSDPINCVYLDIMLFMLLFFFFFVFVVVVFKFVNLENFPSVLYIISVYLSVFLWIHQSLVQGYNWASWVDSSKELHCSDCILSSIKAAFKTSLGGFLANFHTAYVSCS